MLESIPYSVSNLAAQNAKLRAAIVQSVYWHVNALSAGVWGLRLRGSGVRKPNPVRYLSAADGLYRAGHDFAMATLLSGFSNEALLDVLSNLVAGKYVPHEKS
jgi:hypothetical protein